jgi:hypothetical protein
MPEMMSYGPIVINCDSATSRADRSQASISPKQMVEGSGRVLPIGMMGISMRLQDSEAKARDGKLIAAPFRSQCGLRSEPLFIFAERHEGRTRILVPLKK